MQKIGNVSREEMLRTFNLGLGMIVIISPQYADLVKDSITQAGEAFYEVGEVVEGDGKVVFV